MDFAYYRDGSRASIAGEGVQAVLGGIVAAALDNHYPYGNMVMIETPLDSLPKALADELGIAPGESLYTVYAHLVGAPTVSLGDPVGACQPLGAVGHSGNAGVAHLHLEMRLGPAASRFPLMEFYTWTATEEAKTAYLRWRISGDFRHFDPMLVLSYVP